MDWILIDFRGRRRVSAPRPKQNKLRAGFFFVKKSVRWKWKTADTKQNLNFTAFVYSNLQMKLRIMYFTFLNHLLHQIQNQVRDFFESI